jgi:thiamine biosynthesis lipoprotein
MNIIPTILLLIVGVSGACSRPLERFEFTQIRMGTDARIVLYARGEDHARTAAAAAFGRIGSIEDVLSDWQVHSEVAHLRKAPTDTWVTISDDLAGPLVLAEQIRRQTGGAFDIRCGRATAAWRASRSAGGPPSDVEPVGDACLTVDVPNVHIRFTSPVPWLDFGGIGKGWAADEAIIVLASNGSQAALVDIGGDIAIGHAPPGLNGWRISQVGRASVLTLSHCGVATSGASQQSIETDGHTWSHLLDPRTGRWVRSHPNITVIAPTAAQADALASAACVLGVVSLRGCVEDDPKIRVLESDCRP